MPLFHTGNGEVGTKIVVALEPVTDDWFRRALIGALELMCNADNWDERGTATVDYARDKANEMLEGILIDVNIPVIPVGVMQMWLTNTAPAKWLLMRGQSLLRADYPDLFAVIGTTWGASDGTHFNLPDMRSRSPYGYNPPGLGLGNAGGTATVTLTTAQLPAHNHGVNDPGHTHTMTQYNGTPGGATPRAQWPNGGAAGTPSTNSNTTGISIQNTGSGDPVNVLHPVMIVNYIIYAGV